MKARVPLFRTSPVRSVVVDTEATQGATVGVDLRWQDGSLVAESDILNAQAQSSSPAGQGQDLTTDDIAEGQANLYFTNQRAEDAVGGILANSANVTLTYASGKITADLTDVVLTAGGTLQKLAFDAKGRLSQESAATTSDLAEGTNLYYTDARADARITAQKAQPNGLASLDASGKLETTQLPALAITDTFVVNSQAAMLALAAQQGDVCIRTDLNDSFILTTSDPTVLASWQELETPVDGVATFNGRTGNVMPATGDYTAAQVGAEPFFAAGTTSQYRRGDKTWQDFATDVRGAVLTGLSTATNAAISATDSVLSAQGKLQAQISAIAIPQGYIDGLQMQWVSATALTVSSGAAYIPSLGSILQAPSSIAKTGLTLTASTWYHVYLYNSAGTPDVEIVTTAPASPYNGTARCKTGDTSRRYLFSVKTDASGNIYNFLQDGNQVFYRLQTNVAPFRPGTTNPATTTKTSISFAGVVPVTARSMLARISNPDSSQGYWIGTSDDGTATGIFIVAPTGLAVAFISLSSVQDVTYAYQAAATFAGAIDCLGYVFQR